MGVDMGEPRGAHVPVLLERCLELLGPALARPGAVHVDFTLGLGGHAEAVLERYPDVVLIGLDRDTEALAHSRHRLARFAERIHLVHAVYHELPRVLSELDIPAIHSGLFDLGVSSLQLDEADRGFAYAQDAPLDMRMDQSRGITAEEVVNSYEPGELVRILRQYGEEKFAPRIVSSIVRERAKSRIVSTARLAELIKDAIPAAARRTGGNPAKRSFQALRIEVNGELDVLETAIPAALDALSPGGRLVVMSYQSLEDRIVKRALAARARSTGPIDLPVELPGTGPTLRLLTRGSELPSDAEVAENPRAASVKLRAVERIDERENTGNQAPRAGRERPRMAASTRGSTGRHRDTTHGGQGRIRPGANHEGEGKA
ncbi:16S rRNA (cytosine(1402)-N(4))-methyltransferase RsmH [Actinoplanes teichomyceticus]|uniref:Ribosomal RNA small subunit methyltransferase H n=1 Tax=Actinoplanes teichomyceticus TaxID=1867 RepID=A0A561WJ25_ACTTI|nr:16S rRNA (cytosine(1402)-N(4))-methyltransferase RsmH [Actinoplanes teichomyceticus]TWG23875.1 16S rRNA (cytosine1402-N4)-methyltransferase [Actinoplanes teichomyceticus]